MIKIGTTYTKKLKLMEGYVSSAANSVLVNPQTLTEEQKQQACANIAALSINDVDDYMSSESINPVQNKVVQEAIDAVNDTAVASSLTVKQSRTTTDKYVSVLLADNQMDATNAEPAEKTDGGNTFVANGIAANPATGEMAAASFNAVEDVIIAGESVKEKLSNVSTLIQDALDDMNPETLGVYTKTAVDLIVEGVNASVQNTQQLALQNIEQINELRTDQADTAKTIDNLPLYGVNQVIGTTNDFTEVTITDGLTPLNHSTLNNRGDATHRHPYSDYGITIGDSITFSVDIQSPADADCCLSIVCYTEDGSVGVIFKSDLILANATGRCSKTITAPENYIGFDVYIESETPGAKPKYKCFKVEKGNRATPWNDYGVRYDSAQSLTTDQKNQARKNIGAAMSNTYGGGLNREFNKTNTTKTYTTPAGKALLYLVEIASTAHTVKSIVMVDWNMATDSGNRYTYVLTVGVDVMEYGTLEVCSLSSERRKFSVLPYGEVNTHYISRVIGYY